MWLHTPNAFPSCPSRCLMDAGLKCRIDIRQCIGGIYNLTKKPNKTALDSLQDIGRRILNSAWHITTTTTTKEVKTHYQWFRHIITQLKLCINFTGPRLHYPWLQESLIFNEISVKSCQLHYFIRLEFKSFTFLKPFLKVLANESLPSLRIAMFWNFHHRDGNWTNCIPFLFTFRDPSPPAHGRWIRDSL